MPDFVDAILGRIKANKDCTILVTGKTGVGKSTLVGKALFQHFQNIENLRKPGEMMWVDGNYLVDPEKFSARLARDKGNCLWLDEAIDAVSRRNWNSKINNSIINRKNKNRKNGIVSFILLPYEKEVDKNFIKHINIWIWVYERGEAQIFVAGNHRKGGESLSVEKIIEREEKWWKENPGAKKCWPRIHPEYVGNIAFNAFTKDEDTRYNRLVELHSSTGKLSEEEEELIKTKEDEINPEEFVPKILDELERGEIKTKRELWDKLKELTGFSDALLVRHINRHLKIRGFKSFNAFEV
jgi:hypothetical protein